LALAFLLLPVNQQNERKNKPYHTCLHNSWRNPCTGFRHFYEPFYQRLGDFPTNKTIDFPEIFSNQTIKFQIAISSGQPAISSYFTVYCIQEKLPNRSVKPTKEIENYATHVQSPTLWPFARFPI
jgi:hypothetical protein